MTKYKHPDATHTEDVRPSDAAMYESQGWEPVKAAPKADEKPDPKK